MTKDQTIILNLRNCLEAFGLDEPDQTLEAIVHRLCTARLQPPSATPAMVIGRLLFSRAFPGHDVPTDGWEAAVLLSNHATLKADG
jgi:hypothetical protein